MSYYPIIFHNAIHTLTKTWLQALKSHYINNVNQSTYYLISTSLPAMHIPFSALFLSWMSSIPAHQVPTVLQVPIQASQHKDDTNPSCIYSVLFRVLFHYSFLWMFLHPNTPSANSTSSTNSIHPTQGRYPIPLLAVSPCALQGASPSWGTPFAHTSTAPRGYSLHRVPQLMWQSSNVCGTSLNHMSYI